MNKRTAAILLMEDLVVVKCRFNETLSKTYTYVSRKAWLPDELDEGASVLVQASTRKMKIAQFHSYGELEDIDLDNEGITYKFVLGAVPQEPIDRLCEAEAAITNVLRDIQRQRIEALRANIKERLLQQL